MTSRESPDLRFSLKGLLTTVMLLGIVFAAVRLFMDLPALIVPSIGAGILIGFLLIPTLFTNITEPKARLLASWAWFVIGLAVVLPLVLMLMAMLAVGVD